LSAASISEELVRIDCNAASSTGVVGNALTSGSESEARDVGSLNVAGAVAVAGIGAKIMCEAKATTAAAISFFIVATPVETKLSLLGPGEAAPLA
jgi:hypothetical protein